jgi:pimeloyl-ACP methyl ester carboxylesterase
METNVQIIFIPGIMGSTMKHRNKPIWPWSDYLFDSYKLLKDINNPDTYSNKIEPFTYRLLINKLKEITNNVTPFPYDWRQNNLKHLKDLKDEIDPAADEIIFVAHSMGGIIAKLFLNEYREEPFIHKVSKFITLGTPWNGAMDAYKTLKYGKSIPDNIVKIKGSVLNKKTSKEISPYFPSIYQLLPNRKYCKLSQKTEKKVLVSYRKNGRNYYDHDEFFIEHLQNDFDSFKHNYNEVFDDFYKLLDEDIPDHIVHYELIGLRKPTISGITENSLGEAEGDFRNGDGTVPLFSALSNEENVYFVNKVEHQALPKNEEVLTLVTDILNGNLEFTESEKIFKSLSSKFYEGFNGKIVKVACPVEISLVNQEGQVIYGAIETIDDEGLKEIVNQEFNIEELGDTTYLIIDDEKESIDDFGKVIIHAYDNGPTTVSIDEYQNGENIRRKAFKTFKINPDIQAELELSSNIEESALSIEEFGEQPVSIDSRIEELMNEVVYPSTVINIAADEIIEPEGFNNTFIVKGQVTLVPTEIEKGTYEIDSTFIKVNGDLFKVEKLEEFKAKLLEGSNEIEFFTKDIFGNFEIANKIEIVLLPEYSFNLNIEFLSHQYYVEIWFKELYKDVAQKYNISIGNFSWSFDNNEKCFGNDVFYIGKTRKLEIKYKNILGIEEVYSIDIDENIILSIFEGTAQDKNLKDLIFQYFKLNDPKMHFKMPEGDTNGGYFRRISNENIAKCTEILIEEDPIEVKIVKNKKYKISLQNLSEDIILGTHSNYSLMFKVIDNERKKDMRTLNLQFFSKIKGLKDIILTDIKEVYFDPQEDVYVASIDLEEIKRKMNDYWINNTTPILEVNIIEKINGNSLRSQDIFIRV